MSRLLAIGDVHGCATALDALINEVQIHDDDVLVMMGDYVDRGPDSRSVIDWMIRFGESHELIPLRGNHEVMMLNARIHQEDMFRWCRYGGSETLSSYTSDADGVGGLDDIPAPHWRFLEENLRPYYETDMHIFVHASVVPGLKMEEQPEATLYWGAYSHQFPGHASGKLVVCGHKSQDSGLPARNESSICIDTAAYKGQWLTCFDVKNGELWQANQSRETRRLTLDEID